MRSQHHGSTDWRERSKYLSVRICCRSAENVFANDIGATNLGVLNQVLKLLKVGMGHDLLNMLPSVLAHWLQYLARALPSKDEQGIARPVTDTSGDQCSVLLGCGSDGQFISNCPDKSRYHSEGDIH